MEIAILRNYIVLSNFVYKIKKLYFSNLFKCFFRHLKKLKIQIFYTLQAQIFIITLLFFMEISKTTSFIELTAGKMSNNQSDWQTVETKPRKPKSSSRLNPNVNMSIPVQSGSKENRQYGNRDGKTSYGRGGRNSSFPRREKESDNDNAHGNWRRQSFTSTSLKRKGKILQDVDISKINDVVREIIDSYISGMATKQEVWDKILETLRTISQNKDFESSNENAKKATIIGDLIAYQFAEAFENPEILGELSATASGDGFLPVNQLCWPIQNNNNPKKQHLKIVGYTRTREDVQKLMHFLANAGCDPIKENSKRENAFESLNLANQKGYFPDQSDVSYYRELILEIPTFDKSASIMMAQMLGKITETNVNKFRTLFCWIFSKNPGVVTNEIFKFCFKQINTEKEGVWKIDSKIIDICRKMLQIGPIISNKESDADILRFMVVSDHLSDWNSFVQLELFSQKIEKILSDLNSSSEKLHDEMTSIIVIQTLNKVTEDIINKFRTLFCWVFFKNPTKTITELVTLCFRQTNTKGDGVWNFVKNMVGNCKRMLELGPTISNENDDLCIFKVTNKLLENWNPQYQLEIFSQKLAEISSTLMQELDGLIDENESTYCTKCRGALIGESQIEAIQKEFMMSCIRKRNFDQFIYCFVHSNNKMDKQIVSELIKAFDENLIDSKTKFNIGSTLSNKMNLSISVKITGEMVCTRKAKIMDKQGRESFKNEEYIDVSSTETVINCSMTPTQSIDYLRKFVSDEHFDEELFFLSIPTNVRFNEDKFNVIMSNSVAKMPELTIEIMVSKGSFSKTEKHIVKKIVKSIKTSGKKRDDEIAKMKTDQFKLAKITTKINRLRDEIINLCKGQKQINDFQNISISEETVDVILDLPQEEIEETGEFDDLYDMIDGFSKISKSFKCVIDEADESEEALDEIREMISKCGNVMSFIVGAFVWSIENLKDDKFKTMFSLFRKGRLSKNELKQGVDTIVNNKNNLSDDFGKIAVEKGIIKFVEFVSSM